MKVALSIFQGRIDITARAEGSAALGDMHLKVRHGEEFNGYTYEELRSLGNGFHELRDKTKP